MKKRLITLPAVLLCTAMLLFGFAACSNTDKKTDVTDSTQPTAQSGKPTTAASAPVDDNAPSPRKAIEAYIDTVANPTVEGIKTVLPDFVLANVEKEYGIVPGDEMCELIKWGYFDLADDVDTFTVSEGVTCNEVTAASFEDWLSATCSEEIDVDYKEYTLTVQMNNGSTEIATDVIFFYNGTYYSSMAIGNIVNAITNG